MINVLVGQKNRYEEKEWKREREKRGEGERFRIVVKRKGEKE